MKLHIIKNNGKRVGLNVSLCPIRTCSPGVRRACAAFRLRKDGTRSKRRYCYACKFLKRANVVKAWSDNTRLILQDPVAFFAGIREYLRAKQPRFFRLWVAGDYPTPQTIKMVYSLARQCPNTKILSFTKRWLDGWCFPKTPQNMTVVYSAWSTLAKPPKGHHVAWCDDGRETRIPADALECPGRCDQCGMCWSLNEIKKDVYFHVH